MVTVVADGVPAGVPVDTTVAAVDGVKHPTTSSFTFFGASPSLVVNVTIIMLPAGKVMSGKLATVLPSVELIGATIVVPLGNLIVTVTLLTLVLVGGTVTEVMITSEPGGIVIVIELPFGEVKLTPGPFVPSA